MPFPWTPGTALADPQTIDFARRLRSLLPDGFPQGIEGEDGPFFAELQAWARTMLTNDRANRRVKGNASPRTATELLDEWEAAYGLADDATREVSDRQARLVAAASARGGASPSRIATALAGISDSADPQAPTVAEIQTDDLVAEGQLIFQLLTTITEEEWNDAKVRKGVATILGRIVPARNFGQDGAPLIAETLSTHVAEWEGEDSILGRTHLRRTEETSVAASSPAQRLRNYGPGSVLRARDVNAIQDAILRRPMLGTADAPTSPAIFQDVPAGEYSWAFAISINAGVTRLLGPVGDSIDWRKRMVRIALRYDTVDIRPGQAADDSASAADEWIRLCYLGPGDDITTPTTGYIAELGDLHVLANQVDGSLYLRNDSGSAVYVIGLISASPQYDETDGSSFLPETVDGTPLADVAMGQTYVRELADRALLSFFQGSSTADDWKDGEGCGSHSMMFLAVNQGDGESVVVDTSIDWRDRIVLASCIAIHQRAWPGGGIDYDGGPLGADVHAGVDPSDLYTPDMITASALDSGAAEGPVSTITYTAQGQATGASAGTSIAIGAGIRLWVRSSASGDIPAGALMLTRDDVEDSEAGVTLLVMVQGSFRTGKRSTPTQWPEIVAVNGEEITPGTLNGLQDRSLVGVASHSHPLGLQHVTGRTLPYIPRTLQHHGRELAQQANAVGGFKRFFAVEIAGESEIILDDTVDWTDRFVRIVARFSTAAILPGQADDEDFNLEDPTVFSTDSARYTGGFRAGIDNGQTGHAEVGQGLDVGHHVVLIADDTTEDTGLCVYARRGTGYLVLRNQIPGTLQVAGWLDASPQLGFRR